MQRLHHLKSTWTWVVRCNLQELVADKPTACLYLVAYQEAEHGGGSDLARWIKCKLTRSLIRRMVKKWGHSDFFSFSPPHLPPSLFYQSQYFFDFIFRGGGGHMPSALSCQCMHSMNNKEKVNQIHSMSLNIINSKLVHGLACNINLLAQELGT